MTGLTAGGFLSLTALQAEGCGGGFAAIFKVSVTGFAFYVIWHEKHPADWLAALASPYPASPDFPLFRGQNKTPRNTLFINGSTVSTGYCATACGGDKGDIKKWRQRRRTSPAQRYYIPPEGESPQPACKAKPITGRTLAAQGRKARQLAQPSRP